MPSIKGSTSSTLWTGSKDTSAVIHFIAGAEDGQQEESGWVKMATGETAKGCVSLVAHRVAVVDGVAARER